MLIFAAFFLVYYPDMYAIKADNISKVYRFYQKPVHRILEAVRRKPMHKAFSALEGISFCVAPGSTLGIIGVNGAGKSTLLRILARTLNPSGGSIVINGRVAALLELGAGFHQELTGRQNIYLNASLMGMSEKEIKAREKEIIGFADIGEFIDRPIKSYSSGMVVRLGFSIATSVDPDILVVDEALSVGDQRFQEKCIERMHGFRKSGKTIILCSHSMYLINELCQEALWIERGNVGAMGSSSSVVSNYLAFLEESNNHIDQNYNHSNNRPHAVPEVIIESVELRDQDNNHLEYIGNGQPSTIVVNTRCTKERFAGHVMVGIESIDGKMVFVAGTSQSGHDPFIFQGKKAVRLNLPCIPLMSGSYRIKGAIGDSRALRPIHEHFSKKYPVISPRPEFGMFWFEHEWEL